MAGEEGFYDLSSPVFPQQGDIFPNLPLVHPPATPHLTILRELDGRPWTPKPGQLQASSEQFLAAFDDAPEYVAVSAERSPGIVLTQTCDLLDHELWLICPLFSLEGTTIDAGNLFADKYANLFGMPKHPLEYFDAGYLDLGKCFVIRKQVVHEKDRIASLSIAAQHALTDKLSQTLTRPWGYAPGELVPATGRYRCLRCFQFDGLANEIVEFRAGDKFGECADCLKIKKRAQWRILRKHARY
ncbi:MAG TPA: hypothetical protein VFB23_05695 [Candidatus Acidoferrales bacterium]|nr:hypothetical protein [Candidatus Acidoferrales bacterium]